ncbi:PilZ domain-containing protein [Rhodocyclus gracilis]|nr:PilZ domain-containing protein [Rhodocyclus gracilis]
MLPDDRRRTPRFPFHSKGELRLNFMAYRGSLIDLSLHGALFESALFELGVQQGDYCAVDILNLSEESIFTAEGVVAHASKSFIGIKFHPLDDERLKRLQHIGTLNLAPKKLINRKFPSLLQAWASW